MSRPDTSAAQLQATESITTDAPLLQRSKLESRPPKTTTENVTTGT